MVRLGDFAVVGGLAVALGMDAFAAAIATGATLDRLRVRPVFRLSFHFGLFQFLMPLIGWWIGDVAVRRVAWIDHWVAFALLAYIGQRMIHEALSGGDEDSAERADPTRGWSLVTLSVATSIDALAAGLTLALLKVGVLASAGVIGLTAALMTWLGMALGRRVGHYVGSAAEILGGVVLVVIGTRIALSHLFG